MAFITHRACHILGLKDDDLNRFVEEIKAFLVEAQIPETYTVNVSKDQITCCGHIPIGLTVEIEGPKIEPIRNLHEQIYGKVKEICGREHVQYSECSSVETLQNIEGVTFIQG